MTAMTQTTDAAFWNGAARKYAQSKISDMAAYETTMTRTRVHLHATDRVLEIGCGTSSTALLLAPDVEHITASDISSEMIAIGKEKVWDTGVTNVSPVQGVVGDPGLDGPFDAILAFNLLHLLAEPEAAIRQAYAQLPSGGRFISKTPCMAGKRWFLGPLVGLLRLVGKAPSDVQFFKVSALERMITKAGFEIVETGDYPRKMPSHFIVACKP
ncbi:class I SAM-dependent methyltransferase [Gymnodinialimonas hymeniacidonis]|uniref:class I SAM-dependent methyltransferase n=1 Tax=Gymnodinialimonas hymeniacidonis TaxID=3126508 RepID=UPI0034C60F35